MNITLRLENNADHRIVEEVTREAFWNIHVLGCNEHFFLHKLRNQPSFINSLDYVAIVDDQVVGNIVYAEGAIKGVNEEESKVLTFGPLSVLPEYQNKGIGSRLVNHTAQKAKEMGYPAIVIYGDPEYYKRFGFKVSKEFNITNQENKYPAALLVLELYPNALKDIEGVFDASDIYDINLEGLEEFDKSFVEKEKMVTKTQTRFLELVSKYL